MAKWGIWDPTAGRTDLYEKSIRRSESFRDPRNRGFTLFLGTCRKTTGYGTARHITLVSEEEPELTDSMDKRPEYRVHFDLSRIESIDQSGLSRKDFLDRPRRSAYMNDVPKMLGEHWRTKC